MYLYNVIGYYICTHGGKNTQNNDKTSKNKTNNKLIISILSTKH
jgi:hypothetical protein